MGGGVEKGGYIATCAEIAIEEIQRCSRSSRRHRIRMRRHRQSRRPAPSVIGANIMGLGGALFESLEFENGRISNPHFAQYRVPRFRDIPRIEAILLDRKDLPPAGAGETPIVGLAPAIGNAIFDATSIRLRALPLAPVA